MIAGGFRKTLTTAATLHTTCCIAGGGPAGMMLGYLLARAGVDVVVLEKHADFFRDFRGDTIHPSTLEVMHELGILDAFLALPHQQVTHLHGQVFGHSVTLADFTHLPTFCKFLVLTPQWDFLDFLARQANVYPHFALRRQTVVSGLIEEAGTIKGVRATSPLGTLEIRAALVVGADGRHTTVREAAGLTAQDEGAPIDVLWFRLPRAATDPDTTGGYIEPGVFLVTINRGDYWQCAFVIPKGTIDAMRANGLPALQARVKTIVSFLAVDALQSWDDLKLLSVQIDRMPRWHRDGLLCIGDAAHAMSPVGGVGINLAIQDAVAAANLLAFPLREHRLRESDLAAVQARREWPTRMTQRAQVAIQNRFVAPVLAQRDTDPPLPWPIELMQRLPLLQRVPARLIGVGVRPEHVTSPALPPVAPAP